MVDQPSSACSKPAMAHFVSVYVCVFVRVHVFVRACVCTASLLISSLFINSKIERLSSRQAPNIHRLLQRTLAFDALPMWLMKMSLIEAYGLHKVRLLVYRKHNYNKQSQRHEINGPCESITYYIIFCY